MRDRIDLAGHSPVYKLIYLILDLNKPYPKEYTHGELEDKHLFRSEKYTKGTSLRLFNTFPNVFKSEIKQILKENNYDYLTCYKILKETKKEVSWVNSVWNTIAPRSQYDEPDMFDLEVLRDVDRLETLKKTDQEKTNFKAAQVLNQSEYEVNNELISCSCCYTDHAFEMLCQCNDGHLFCFSCVGRYLNEMTYGQTPIKDQGRIPCMDMDGCQGSITRSELMRAVPIDVIKSFDTAVAHNEIELSGLHIINCPFCRYCEADKEPALREFKWFNYIAYTGSVFSIHSWAVGLNYTTSSIMILFLVLPNYCFLLLLSLVAYHNYNGLNILTEFPTFKILQYLKKDQLQKIFTCKSPECSKQSCLKCFQQCTLSHICYESEFDALRLKIEQAMAAAVKHTCPICNLSFTKLDGCNKLTCRCGYIMCHMCGKGIAHESYAHFCDHFQLIPDIPCKLCTKCHLYKEPNLDEASRRAAQRAYREFMEENPNAIHIELPENLKDIIEDPFLDQVGGMNMDQMKELVKYRLDKWVTKALNWLFSWFFED
jgi:hypothetical protein